MIIIIQFFFGTNLNVAPYFYVSTDSKWDP